MRRDLRHYCAKLVTVHDKSGQLVPFRRREAQRQLRPGRNAFILTHEDKSMQELFDVVKKIHDNMPAEYRPDTVAANANELAFAGIESGTASAPPRTFRASVAV
jgi:hypothetical protein